MANVVQVNKNGVRAFAPGVIDQIFNSGDKVAPNSPYYAALVAAGVTTDTGLEFDAGVAKVFRPTQVVVSTTDPNIAPPGVWIQDLGNDNWTMWFAKDN